MSDNHGNTTNRHDARERAFHLLYETEIKGDAITDVLASLPVGPDEFAAELVIGVGENQVELDDIIAAHARNWDVDRMPALDRAILRLATYELLHRPDVPTAVVISEAVGLAKSYSTDDSSRYVNGVLSAVAGAVR
ncbi:MAG: transcription antitermination factor NusB [Acidimicrobiales bacterium]